MELTKDTMNESVPSLNDPRKKNQNNIFTIYLLMVKTKSERPFS